MLCMSGCELFVALLQLKFRKEGAERYQVSPAAVAVAMVVSAVAVVIVVSAVAIAMVVSALVTDW